MKELNLIEDLSNLTQIPIDILQKINSVAEKDICNLVYEEYVNSEKSILNINIGIGILKLDLETEEGYIQYTFEPSRKLEKSLIKTINEEESPLIVDIENKLKTKVLSLYKELV